MKKFSCLLIASALFIGLFNSCTKQGANGDIGPQGPTGAQGNANVTPKTDSTNSSSNWTFFPGNGWYSDFVIPTLTSTFIKNGGIVQVFLSTDNGKVWSTIPTTYYVDSVLSGQWTYSYYTSNVQLNFTWSDTKQHTDPVTTYAATCLFNIVLIAPATMKKYPGTDWSNYKSVILIPELAGNQEAHK